MDYSIRISRSVGGSGVTAEIHNVVSVPCEMQRDLGEEEYAYEVSSSLFRRALAVMDAPTLAYFLASRLSQGGATDTAIKAMASRLLIEVGGVDASVCEGLLETAQTGL
jgi:hypothetical protein